ncbi:hypothetical protein SAMN05216343_12230 [Oscillibacter sp. PC13]|uniref:hypothetical protein n=1 Tax=Oscillibacter sp. PC13 TaxID=1855299 RepID=UPI0008E5B97F|nr:hypothetical protein [Oscillibacter sp. PC13]SFQ06222.1 hypothetical protein SAMN05216343_12230 [Oscillibacter sp. PC13]
MQLYLAVMPAQLQDASRYCRNFAHVAYRIGSESTLLRQSLLLQTHGGLLSVSDGEMPPVLDSEKLCAAVLRECNRRGYSGVLLDFEAPPTRDRSVFVERLEAALSASKRSLYIPESYGRAASGAVPLICTAISGGNFMQRLQEAAAARGGAGRLALDVQRLRMDFLLPARTGEGRPLTEAEFYQLMEREQPSVFFSQDLCARYFTYTRENQTHFVLFDDAETLLQKLRTGSGMGFSAAFLMYPEVKDILPKLFAKNGKQPFA